MAVQTVLPRKNRGSADTNRERSPNIWFDCPFNQLVNGELNGTGFFDDFEEFGLPGTQTTEINLGNYKVYNTGAGTVKSDSMTTGTAANRDGGVISMLCDTAGDQSVIGTHACPYYLTTTYTGKLWFEARIATTGIATNRSQIFVGLSNNVEVTFGAAIPLADADAVGTAVNGFGFTALEDGLAVLNTSYCDEAAAWTHVETSAGTLAANTWIKVGFVVDYKNKSKPIRFFVNNLERDTGMSKATMLALTHLDVSGLGLCFAQFADSAGTSNYAYMDWWQVAQMF